MNTQTTDFSAIDMMFKAIEQGDMDSLRTCFTPDALIWHNFDGVDADVDTTVAILGGLCAASSSRSYEDRRRTTVGSLAFLQHTLTAELPSGDRLVLPAMMRVEVADNGLISRIDEYFDSRATDVLGGNAHPNAQLLQRIYRRDPDGFEALLAESFAEDFVCYAAGSGWTGGTYVGLPQMLGHLGDMDRYTDDTLKEEPLEFFATDTWAFVPQIMRGTHGEKTLDMEIGGIWRFDAAGRLAEHWEVVSDQAGWDEFWGDPKPSAEAG